MFPVVACSPRPKPTTGGTPWEPIAFEHYYRRMPPASARSWRVIFGDRREIACIPHTGCRLEILATAPTSHRALNLLLPGQVLRYKRSFFLGDRFELPGATTVSLRHLVGFKPQLAQRVTRPSGAVGRRPRSEPERVTVSETHESLTTQP